MLVVAGVESEAVLTTIGDYEDLPNIYRMKYFDKCTQPTLLGQPKFFILAEFIIQSGFPELRVV